MRSILTLMSTSRSSTRKVRIASPAYHAVVSVSLGTQMSVAVLAAVVPTPLDLIFLVYSAKDEGFLARLHRSLETAAPAAGAKAGPAAAQAKR